LEAIPGFVAAVFNLAVVAIQAPILESCLSYSVNARNTGAEEEVAVKDDAAFIGGVHVVVAGILQAASYFSNR